MTNIVSESTKNIRKMVSTYITECGSKGPASQSVSLSQSVCLYLTDRLTSVNRSVCPSLSEMTYLFAEDTNI